MTFSTASLYLMCSMTTSSSTSSFPSLMSSMSCKSKKPRKVRQKKEEKNWGWQLSSWQMFGFWGWEMSEFGGCKCPNFGGGKCPPGKWLTIFTLEEGALQAQLEPMLYSSLYTVMLIFIVLIVQSPVICIIRPSSLVHSSSINVSRMKIVKNREALVRCVFWTPMCQKIWAGVSPSLPIPKLTQYVQFVKRGQKIWAGHLPPLIWAKSKRTASFFRETFP